MERESIEGGLVRRSLLAGQKLDDINALEEPPNDSSVTAALLLCASVACCASLAYGCSAGYSSPAESGIMADLGLSSTAYSVFSSTLTIGGMIGALISGRLADFIGRKGTMWLSDILFTAGWFAIAFGKFIGLFFIPESPRWLAKIGRKKELEAALQRLRGKNTDISQEAADIIDYTETFQQLSESRFFNLFQKKYAHSLIVGVGLMLLQQFGGTSSISYYASDIFESAGFSSTVGSRVLAILEIPATILGVLLTDKSGRRPLLMISATGMFFSYLLVGLSFLLQDLHHLEGITAILVFVGLLTYNTSLCLGMGGIPWVVMSEIFPINIKGSAGSLVVLVNWFCSWITTYTYGFMMEWSLAGTFFIYSTVCAATVLFVAKLVPETKGRTLEEIQTSMTRFLY